MFRAILEASLSPDALQRREADLVRMRAKFKRERSERNARAGAGVKSKKVVDPEVLDLADLARAIRYAKKRYTNAALLAQLELAATYLDDAAKPEEEPPRVIQL